MLLGAVMFTLLLPIQCADTMNMGFVVQATVDTAKIIGLPASKLVIEKNRLAQQPSFFENETLLTSKPVPWRKLFFRNYFQKS